jgi:uncharacterized protein YbjT (DUF2867 family)
MSQISARRIAKSHAAQNHWIAERLLDRSGIPVTHLRPTFFAKWLMYVSGSIKERNMFPLPFGDARYAPIAAEDQGRSFFRNERFGGEAHGSKATSAGGLHHQAQSSVDLS